jgi:hypothetical protein
MIHEKNCKPCASCRKRDEALRARRLRVHMDNKARMIARRDGILSGKVEVLYLRDEVTGIHYRQNKNGGYSIGGCGDAR